MSFKCPICERTFSQRTAYSQHVQKCLKKAENDVEMDTEDDQNSNFEKDNIGVIILF
jgi:uncharacterized Zn finger protein (UPF0148 family)